MVVSSTTDRYSSPSLEMMKLRSMVVATLWSIAVQQTVTVVQSGNDETAQHCGGSTMVDSRTTDRYSSPVWK